MKTDKTLPRAAGQAAHDPNLAPAFPRIKVLRDCYPASRSNPFDASRFIATEDAEWSGDNLDGSDYLMSGELIAAMRDVDPRHAAFIVRACNSHAALLAALEQVAARLDRVLRLQCAGLSADETNDRISTHPDLCAARAALALAKEDAS